MLVVEVLNTADLHHNVSLIGGLALQVLQQLLVLHVELEKLALIRLFRVIGGKLAYQIPRGA